MKAMVKVTKSFDDGKKFSKEWKPGDFREFFGEEGEYLDKLAGIVEEHGERLEGYTVTYTVKVTK